MSMSDIKYSDVIAHLLQALPDIREYYERRSAELYAVGKPHVVYGSILVEYINSLANDAEGLGHGTSDTILERVFALIEELSASTDFETRCLVETSVLEALLGERGGLERFVPYMCQETKKLARNIVQEWGLNTDLLNEERGTM